MKKLARLGGNVKLCWHKNCSEPFSELFTFSTIQIRFLQMWSKLVEGAVKLSRHCNSLQ